MSTLGPHLLGRVAPPDQRHVELHPFLAALPPARVETVLRRPTTVYDQGQTPQCVAYSTSRVMNWFNGYSFDPSWLYAQCKMVDGMPGVDGTNARAACDILRTRGHLRTIRGEPVHKPNPHHGIQGNTWATSVDGIRTAFAEKAQPVLIGIDWYEAWFTPISSSYGWTLPPIGRSGNVAGGHEIGIWAASDRREAFGLVNTWGAGWPEMVWLPYETMTELFANGADACVIQDLPTR